jgi:NADH dehydrogenase FAD-containing subunit
MSTSRLLHFHPLNNSQNQDSNIAILRHLAMSDILEFYSKALRAMFGLAISRTIQQIKAAGHRFTYRQTINPKAVVVIGGSYAGTYLAQRLSETLPSGYKAVLIERNSHFNHLFVFPRFGIIPGREHMAFIPYDGLSSWGPPGIFQHIRDSVTGITSNQVQLASGKSLDYEYLALATGTWQPPPSKASSTEKSEACTELRFSQNAIHNASRIEIVGGGPVGVQIATDIASFFPNKDVTLVHSRQQLLPNFGPKLHKHVLQSLDHLKVNVILGDRPQLVPKDPADAKPSKLSFKGGHVVDYDLVVRYLDSNRFLFSINSCIALKENLNPLY